MDGFGTTNSPLPTPFGSNFSQGDGKTSTPKPSVPGTGPSTSLVSLGEPHELRSLNLSGINTSFSEQSSFNGPMRSSSRAFKGPYSRPPSLTPNGPSSTTRYTPYGTRKPVYLPAKKMDSVQGSPKLHLSTTAQKMLDILQKNSTPVVEGAKKISLNQLPFLKTLKPIFPSVRSGTPQTSPQLSGPPVKRSAPDFDSCEPKRAAIEPKKSATILVDCATNTSEELFLNFEIPKECLDCKYKFRKAWNIEELYDKIPRAQSRFAFAQPSSTLGTAGATNSENIRLNSGSIPSNSNGPSASFVFGAPTNKPVVSAFQSPPSNSIPRFPLASSSQPNPSPTPQLPSVTSNQPTLNNDTVSDAGPRNLAGSYKRSKWECGTCMVYNEPSASKCVCCETKAPTLNNKTAQMPDTGPKDPVGSKISSKWECGTCMVYNEPSASKCVCCETEAPKSTETCDKTDAKFPTLTSVQQNPPALSGPTTSSSFVFGFAKPAVTSSPTLATAVTTKSETAGFNTGSFLPVSNGPSASFVFGAPTNEKKAVQSPPSNSIPTFSLASSNQPKIFPTPQLQSVPSNQPALNNNAVSDTGPRNLTGSKNPSKWECEACMVYNEPSASKCVCCETEKLKQGGSCDKTDSKFPTPTSVQHNLPASSGPMTTSSFVFGFAQPAASVTSSSTLETSVTTKSETAGFNTGSFPSNSNGPSAVFAFGSQTNKPVIPAFQSPTPISVQQNSPPSSAPTTTSSFVFSFTQPTTTSSSTIGTAGTTTSQTVGFNTGSFPSNSNGPSGVFAFGAQSNKPVIPAFQSPTPAFGQQNSPASSAPTTTPSFGFSLAQPAATSSSTFGTAGTTKSETAGFNSGSFPSVSNGPSFVFGAQTNKPVVPAFQSSNSIPSFPLASSNQPNPFPTSQLPSVTSNQPALNNNTAPLLFAMSDTGPKNPAGSGVGARRQLKVARRRLR